MLSQTAARPAPAPLAPDLPAAVFSMRFARDEEIYGEGEEAEYVYKVISGAVRTCAFDAEGRRQIEGFYLPGDLFGLECGAAHRFAAEALCDTEVAIMPRAALDRAALDDGAAARALWSLASEALRQTREHLLVLGKKGAAERVVGFLLQMAQRCRGGVVRLPMSRTDIADYLGLTIETVSRTFSKLERDGAIALEGARQVALNLGRLNAFAA
ncbi:MAG: helix-turn-helix domain-containing protein [Hyphomonadaceae bacterium]